MRFSVHDHLNEAQPLVEALINAGHVLSSDGPTDLFLLDLDPDMWGYRDIAAFYRECGAVVLQYPHGAPFSTLVYDNLYAPAEEVDGQLTYGQGEIDFLRSINVERPAKIMGWDLCRQFEFRPTDNPRRVVFAPTHVNGDGTIDASRAQTNADVFRDLLEGDWELVVRFIGDLERVGLWRDDRVFRYVPGRLDMTTVEIDVADCVVAGAGTYPCLAIARGVPTIMYGQFAAAMYGLEGEEPKPLRSLEKYREIVRYPFDVEDAGDSPVHSLSQMIYYACDSDRLIRDWKKRWIGEPFSPEAFVAMVEVWIPELRETRSLQAA